MASLPALLSFESVLPQSVASILKIPDRIGFQSKNPDLHFNHILRDMENRSTVAQVNPWTYSIEKGFVFRRYMLRKALKRYMKNARCAKL